MAELVVGIQIPLRIVIISIGGAVCALTAFVAIAEPGAARSALLGPRGRRVQMPRPQLVLAGPPELGWASAGGSIHHHTTATQFLGWLADDSPAERSRWVPPVVAPTARPPACAPVATSTEIPVSVATPRTSGTLFGPYQLLALIAVGGMGEVWRCIDLRIGREIAMKRLNRRCVADPIARERFHRESTLLAALTTTRAIPVHEAGDIDGEPYIAMKLAGANLAQLLHDHPAGLPPRFAAQLIEQIAEALSAIHDAGYLHRDIKLSNVLLDADEPDQHCYLIDVGIARRVGDPDSDAADRSRLTAPLALLGTPAYMAPELFVNSSGSIRTDVYALGVLAYQLLSGHSPFQGPDPIHLVAQHQHEIPPPLSPGRPDLALADAVLATALAKNPADRHADPAAFAAAVTEAVTPSPAAEELDGGVVHAGPRDVDRSIRSNPRHSPRPRLTTTPHEEPAA